jgi:hypothetical protein
MLLGLRQRNADGQRQCQECCDQPSEHDPGHPHGRNRLGYLWRCQAEPFGDHGCPEGQDWGAVDADRERASGSGGLAPRATASAALGGKRLCAVQTLIAEIKNPRSKLRGIGGRKEADQKNAASCGEYVPKEIQHTWIEHRPAASLPSKVAPDNPVYRALFPSSMVRSVAVIQLGI